LFSSGIHPRSFGFEVFDPLRALDRAGETRAVVLAGDGISAADAKRISPNSAVATLNDADLAFESTEAVLVWRSNANATPIKTSVK
jgi:hypothetical protein